MSKLIFKDNRVEDFSFVLSTRSQKHEGEIVNVDPTSVTYKTSLSGANELSLTIYKSFNNRVEPLWEKIIGLKLIYVPQIQEYFQIDDAPLSDSLDSAKTITAKSLCEAELGQIKLNDTEINTEVDIARDSYTIPTVFYRPQKEKKYRKASLLHRILEKAPGYTIKYVDPTLMNIQRSFSINGTDIYSFLTGDCAIQFGCLFTFDSTDRSISVYDLNTVCQNPECNYRGEFQDVCPKCGGTNLKYFGEDTTVLISKENLTDEITLSSDISSVKNVVKLGVSDDAMSAAVRNLLANGTDYIYYLTKEQKEDMSSELNARIEQYDRLYNELYPRNRDIVEKLYELIDLILYKQSEMMPEVKDDEVTAKSECNKLNAGTLSPIALSKVSSATSASTVASTIKNYLPAFVNTGKYKATVESRSFTYKGVNSDGYNYGVWTGYIKLENWGTIHADKDKGEEVDEAQTGDITLTVTDDYEKFLQQSIDKKLAGNSDDDEGSIFDVLKIKDLTAFKKALTYYCLSRLTSFHDAIQSALDVLIAQDQASVGADFYQPLYVPYYEKLKACEAEMDIRQKEIDDLTAKQESLEKERETIVKQLDFTAYLGEKLAKEFSYYRREDVYQNDNFISDGLTNAELMERAEEFIQKAKDELYKSGERQYSATANNLYNLLVIPEFKPIVDHFQLGNWIRVEIDGEIYRLRLVSYTVSWSDLSTIQVEFSELTKTKNGYNDIGSILSKASSMASSFSYVTKQAEKGSKVSKSMEQVLKDGLNSALVNIKNNTNEEVTITNLGIEASSYDDTLNESSPEKMRMTHNLLVYTDNNWASVRQAIGKHKFTIDGEQVETYGVSSDVMLGGKMIAGEIYSGNYNSSTGRGTYMDLENGNFSLADGRFKYDASTNKLNLKGVTLDWNTTNDIPVDSVDGLSERLDDISKVVNDDLKKEVNAIVESVNKNVLELQSQIDGNITTWFYEGIPTTTNLPAKNWTTDEARNKQLGDLYYDTKTGYTYRYQLENNVYSWTRIEDSDVTKALNDAATAQDTADHKRRVFIATPTPPYDAGDLWSTNGANGDIKICKTSRSAGSYLASDWQLASKYTDDTVANAAKTAAENAQKAIDAYKISNAQFQTMAQNAKNTGSLLVDKLGFKETSITGKYIIAPSITGGYINIINPNNGSVIIDPSNLENSGYIFAVKDRTGNLVMGVNTKGDAFYSGTISWDKVSGTSEIATKSYVTTRGYTDDTTANAAKTAAANAQSTANTAVSDAKTAQTTANNATTAAATAQSTANTAKTNASNAQSTANTAVNAAKTAQETADAAVKSANVNATKIVTIGNTADSAKTLGDNLKNVLGYDGTKISGTYLYSPVISGGSLMIGDKNGTYAEISTKGVLTANGIKAINGEFSGKLTSSEGKIAGFTIGTAGFSSEFSHTWYKPSSSDIQTVASYANKSTIPDAILEKYDYFKNGKITLLNQLIASGLNSGKYDATSKGRIIIDPTSDVATIRFEGTQGYPAASGIIKTNIGVANVTSQSISGAYGTFTNILKTYNNFQAGIITNSDGSETTSFTVLTGENGIFANSKLTCRAGIYINGNRNITFTMNDWNGSSREFHPVATTSHLVGLDWGGSYMNYWVDRTWFGNWSDKRLKKDIGELPDGYYKAIGNVDIKQFRMTPKLYDNNLRTGCIAQELIKSFETEKIDPFQYLIMNTHELGEGDDTKYYEVDKIEFLMGRIVYDEHRISCLEKQIKELKGEK